MPDDDFPEGWVALLPEQAPVFLAQLLAELGPGHPLAGHVARAIGVFGGSDDAVFLMTGWRAPYAVAHLAWPGPDPRPWLLRRLRPWPRHAPALHPLDRLTDLAGWFDG